MIRFSKLQIDGEVVLFACSPAEVKAQFGGKPVGVRSLKAYEDPTAYAKAKKKALAALRPELECYCGAIRGEAHAPGCEA